MAKIYIVLMHSMTAPAKLVKFATRYKYSHVAIALEKECNTLYSFGRKKPNNPFDGGYSVENRDGGFFKKFPNAVCRVYEWEVSDTQKEALEKILFDMKKTQSIYKYDFLGAFLRFFKIPVQFKNLYTCTSFVAWALEKTGIYSFDIPTMFVIPKHFENIKNLNQIYEGKYLDM